MSYTQATESTVQASSQPTRLSSPQSNNLPQPTGVKQGDLVVVQFGSYTTPAYTWFKGLRIPILPGEVAKALGKTIDVRYIVNGLDQSPRLQLYVQPIEDGDAALLPTPTFKELERDVLDATKTATLHVDPWPLMAIGQKVWCVVHGTDTNNQATSITLWTSDAVIASELINGCNKVLPSAWLKTLEDGSNIQIEFLVTFDQSTVRANAVVFPVKPYRIKNLEEFVLDPTEMKLDVGKTGTRTPTGGQPPYGYISSNTGVATVNASGTVTAVNAGTATITVRDSASPHHSGTYLVSVVAAFYIDPSTVSLTAGNTYARQATGGQPPYTYTSNAPSIVQVTNVSQGDIKALAAGIAMITARDAGASSVAYPVEVKASIPPVDFGSAVSLNCSGYLVAEGRPPRNPPANATYTRQATGGRPPYTYGSSDPVVASIDAAGTVKIGANGTCMLTATDQDGKRASHTLTVYGASVWRHRPSWGLMTYAEQTSVHAREPDLEPRCPRNPAEIDALRAVYLPESSNPANLLGWLGNYMWTSEVARTNHYWVKSFGDGSQDAGHYDVRSALMCPVKPYPGG